MIRYIRQTQDATCTPVAIVNALKFQRHPSARRGKLLLKKIKKQVKCERDGTAPETAQKLYRKLGFRRMNRPGWDKIHIAILRGNAVLATICFVEAFTDTPVGNRIARECTVGAHTFLLVGCAVNEGKLLFRAINIFQPEKHKDAHIHWYTPETIIEEYSVYPSEVRAWIRDAHVVPGEPDYGRKRRKRSRRRR